MLFLHNTSRVEDEPYPTLLQDKGFGGFPSLCFMDEDGNVLAKPGRSVAGFAETHTQSKALVALRAKPKRSAAEEKELFLTEMKLDLVPADAIQARADKLTLTEGEKLLVSAKLVDAEVAAIMQKARSAGPEETAAKLAKLAAAGKVPSEAMGGRFWPMVLQHASKEKDAALAQTAHDALLKVYANESGPRFDQAKEAWKKLLDDAKAK